MMSLSPKFDADSEFSIKNYPRDTFWDIFVEIEFLKKNPVQVLINEILPFLKGPVLDTRETISAEISQDDRGDQELKGMAPNSRNG